MFTARRDSGVPFGAGICATSTEFMEARTFGPAPTECSPYRGWKHPASRHAATNGAASRTAHNTPRRETPKRISSHHIDDPVRDDDDLFRGLPVQRLLHGI